MVQPACEAWNWNNWLSICISGDLFEQSRKKAIVKRPPLLMIGAGQVGALVGTEQTISHAYCEWIAFAPSRAHAPSCVRRRSLRCSPRGSGGIALGHAGEGPVLVKAPVPRPYDWTGFYTGVHLGYTWGRSNWTEQPDGLTGSLNMFQRYDAFSNTGSWFGGLQAGYDYMLPNRVVIGAVADLSAPSLQSLNGISIGGTSTFISPMLGQESYSENVLDMGTVRGRVGYAPGNWLFYATGGFAWAYDQLTVTQLDNSGTTEFLFCGGSAGPPVRALRCRWRPIGPRVSSICTRATATAPWASPMRVKTFQSDLSFQELRLTLNYRPGADQKPADDAASWFAPKEDRINVHGQTTFVWQAYPAIRSPYEGTKQSPGPGPGPRNGGCHALCRYSAVARREVWIDPEIDQGHGLGIRMAWLDFRAQKATKLAFPSLTRGFSAFRPPDHRSRRRRRKDRCRHQPVRQLDNSQSSGADSRQVRYRHDLLDTNKYANNPKIDFLNWSLMNAGTFDYAGDGWGSTYGVATEWYQGRWTLRAGLFDLSATPAGGDKPKAGRTTSTFRQLEMVGEIEERHELWGQPGKAQGHWLSRARADGNLADAIQPRQSDPDSRRNISAVRRWNQPSRREYQPGAAGLRRHRRVRARRVGRRHARTMGLHRYRPYDFRLVFQSPASMGQAGRYLGIAGVLNDISGVHQAFFNAGGLGHSRRGWPVAEPRCSRKSSRLTTATPSRRRRR